MAATTDCRRTGGLSEHAPEQKQRGGSTVQLMQKQANPKTMQLRGLRRSTGPTHPQSRSGSRIVSHPFRAVPAGDAARDGRAAQSKPARAQMFTSARVRASRPAAHAANKTKCQQCIIDATTVLPTTGTWCSGITPAQHAGGPGFNPQCVQISCACAGTAPASLTKDVRHRDR